MEELEMSIKISKNDVCDIDNFIRNYLVDAMNKSGLNYPAMALILETLFDKIAVLNEYFKEGEDNE